MGCNDIALSQRRRLLINNYTPEEWKLGKLRPAPLTADTTDALLEFGFDKDEVNSQYQILEGAKSTKTEDNKNIVGKVHSKASFEDLLCPSLEVTKATTKRLPHLTYRGDYCETTSDRSCGN